MKLLCGLGNPGRAYLHHRHNVGFMVVDALAARWTTVFSTHKFDAAIAWATVGAERVLLLKPQTFMNESGESVATAAHFYRLAPSDVLVIHDELDLPFGRVRLKSGGGGAGHRGLASIYSRLASDAFTRVRIGIGKPEAGRAQVVGHVLGNFAPEEQTTLDDVLTRAVQICESWLAVGLEATMNRYHRD